MAEANQEDLSFFHHERYLNDLKSTKAGAVLVPIEFKEPIKHVPLLKVKSPSLAFNEIAKDLYASNDELDVTGIHETAIIGKGVRLDPESVSVGPYVVIGSDTEIGDGTTLSAGVRIGNNISIGKKCSLFPNVVVYDHSQIGNNVQVHGGTVIGSDGFGFSPQKDGNYKKIPQTGIVILGNNVDVGSNSTIDRATLGVTSIGNGVKLDNQIQIAHNVEIGENTVIAAQSGVAGSAKIGKNCVIGGQVGIVGHINIGDNVKIQGKSGVISNIKQSSTIQGTPAFSYNDYNKSYVYFKNLPNLAKEINRIIKKLNP